ncbi:MAG: hypothetical protein DME33_01935 [Verrucomicrobia bacterium]|nr:MAG: hypothetical protein DME33_01935 [Verrucomicrobiota bacterium]
MTADISFGEFWIVGGHRLPLHFLTSFHHADSLAVERSIVGENRGIDRILRRLKLHAEGRQFGG